MAEPKSFDCGVCLLWLIKGCLQYHNTALVLVLYFIYCTTCKEDIQAQLKCLLTCNQCAAVYVSDLVFIRLINTDCERLAFDLFSCLLIRVLEG